MSIDNLSINEVLKRIRHGNLPQDMLNSLPRSALQQLQQLLTPKMTKYIPHKPTPKQAAFLLLPNREAFYGGAAGGGKSEALLMAALQYVDVPGYRAILIRRTYTDLALPGALMDRAAEWLEPYKKLGEVRWDEKEKTWEFYIKDGGKATLTFGYLEHANDKYRYQGAEFQFIGFDELTQIRKSDYLYMFSRLRRLKNANVPLRIRAASNPGGEGHDWVKERFLEKGFEENRVFIPATMYDNPYLDIEEYEAALDELDPITRAQLKEGNWNVKHGGSLFDRNWFEIVNYIPEGLRYVRYWDLAATEKKPGKDPDYTVGLLLGEANGIFYVVDVIRFRKTPAETEDIVRRTAERDGYAVRIFIEEEPGSSGKITIDHYARNVLKGYAVWGNRETGSKILRAQPVSAAAEKGYIKIVKAPWNTAFLDELEAFPNVNHDDQIDALSGAFRMLTKKPTAFAIPVGVGGGSSYWHSRLSDEPTYILLRRGGVM